MENQFNVSNTCKECGDKLKGRADKVFCNDACRSAFNNRRNREQSTIPIRRLENKGFLFNFFTHTEEPNKGNCYRYCYDFGYAEAKNGELMITKYPGTYL
jgi:predicted nucleic acid-binding Zn ribbon protein